MECYGELYGYEETLSNGNKNFDCGIEMGEKCIIDVFPSAFHIYKIDNNFSDRKGSGGMGNEFSPSQLEVAKREIQEGIFLFKRKFYIIDLAITYPNVSRTFKYTIKVDKRDGKNILTTLDV